MFMLGDSGLRQRDGDQKSCQADERKQFTHVSPNKMSGKNRKQNFDLFFDEPSLYRK